LTFKACSEPEVTGWLLSFGDQEKLIEPDWLVRRLRKAINRMGRMYEPSAISRQTYPGIVPFPLTGLGGV